jgi:hypothetical protein
MTTAGDNITKANIVASMESIRNSFNSSIVWHTGNDPFTPSITNTYGPAGVSPLGGDSTGYATGSFSTDISDNNVTASTITTNFRAYATLLSRIRNVRLLKWFQIQGDIRAQLDYDNTNITNLKGDWAADMSTVSGPASENTVSASDLDNFVNALSTAINNNRTNTLTFEEFYCHSNCHGSCHGSL